MFVSSANLAEEFESLRNYFDIVVLDLPAVSSNAGVLSLTEFADSFVLVVRQGTASRTKIRNVLEDLDASRFAGVVLNEVSDETPRWFSRLTGK